MVVSGILQLYLPGKPVACNYGLLWAIVACYFGLLGVPGMYKYIFVRAYRYCSVCTHTQQDCYVIMVQAKPCKKALVQGL